MKIIANKTSTAVAIVLASTGLAAPSVASAQNINDANAEATDNSGLTAIVVTARRTSENLQDVPIAISAFDEKALEDKAVRDIYDLQEATPALRVSAGQSQGRIAGGYNIRGQSAAADDAPPGVVTYLNDVPVYGTEISRALFDLSVVQVLKGPQGTLFGKNTNGGAILFNTKRPTFDFEGYVTARYGNLDDKYLEGAINIPLGDTVAIRAAGNIERRDGYTKNLAGRDLDNLRYGNGRVSIRIEPNDNFSNDLVFNYTSINERGPGYILATYNSTPPILGGGALPPSYTAAANAQLGRDNRTVSNANAGFTRAESFGVSNTTIGRISDNVTLKNIFAYHDQKYAGLLDYDNLPIDLLSVEYARHSKQITEELQLQIKTLDDRLELILGGFYLSSKEDPFSGQTRFGATSAGYVLTPLFFYSLQDNHRDETSKALFAQASFEVTDRLNLTGGFRYTWDEQRMQDTHQNFFVPGTIILPFQPGPDGFTTCQFSSPPADSPFTIDVPNCQRKGEVSFSAPNWVITADYNVTDDVMLYLSHRHGYKSGGFNTTSSFSGQANIFTPEKVNDIEGGLKIQTYLGGAEVRLNASAFHSWYKNLQLTQVINDPSGPQSLTQNVGKARLWGGEADLAVVPFDGLTLTGTLAYFDGKFTEGTIIDSNAGLINLAGVKYRSQPKLSWTLGANYTTAINDDSDISASVFYSGRKGYYTNYQDVPGNFIDGYGLVNARLGVTNMGGTGIDLAVFGKNIFDKEYVTSTSRGGTFGYEARLFGDPALYGIEATIRFGGN